MLELLSIWNFQAHEEEVVELSPTVNCFIGPSDVGKSAVLRSLRWISLNRPQGDTFVREGSGKCTVKLKVDGHTVVRKRGAGENAYLLDGKEFKAFGNEVPPEVASLLNVSELNFARQHEAPFWLSLSPGQVSRELNAIVDLDVIDSTLAAVAAEVRQAKAEVEVSEKRLAQARGERDGLAWVKGCSDDLNAISGIEGASLETRLKRSRIEELLQEGEAAIRRGKQAAGAMLGGRKAVQAGEKAEEAGRKAESLRELLNKASEAEMERCKASESLADARRKLRELTKGGCPLCGQPVPSPSPC